MKSPWHLLGSSLWLRPVEGEDPPRIRSFLSRRGLLATANAPAGEDLSARGVRRRVGEILLATDPSGAPAGVFRITGAQEEGAIGFVVHEDDLAHLREALRLVSGAARLHTRWARITIPSVPPNPELARALFEAGWDRDGSSWVHSIDRERSPASAVTAHAG